MSDIDERVVTIQFDNKQFEQGISTTLESLAQLNKSLQLQGATKGLNDVDSAAKSSALSNMASAVENVASKFSAMGVIGVTALTTLTSKAVTAGIQIAKSFTIDPVKDGFDNYETQINAVQTILANTGLVGQAGLNKVNAVLAQLNTYANQTVYNFSDMAKNIGTFTAAGVGLQTSVNSIKGIANLAALSGSSAEQASTAMYQLSQSIASGKVQLQDWNSVVNAGLGGKVFQDALVNTARASGVAIDSIIKKAGSFRNSLQQGWLTSDILTKTLTQFTGDLSVAQIKAMGYTEKQAEQIYALSQTAVNAATKIKTFTQLTQALKEEVGTAYAAIFKTIFGDINTATALFTAIHNVAENALTKPIYDLNALLQGWVALGGRTQLIADIKVAFQDLGRVMGAIKGAFEEIFPPATAQQLYNLTLLFSNFVDYFKMGDVSLGELKRTFAGVFALLDIGWQILQKLGQTFDNLFRKATDGSGGFLKVTAQIGDFLVALDKAIKNGDDLNKFFDKLQTALTIPIVLVQALGKYLGELFDHFNSKQAIDGIGSVVNQILAAGDYSKNLVDAWNDFLSAVSAASRFVDNIEKKVSSIFKSMFMSPGQSGTGSQTAGDGATINFQNILSAISSGVFTGFYLMIRKFFKSLQKDPSVTGNLLKTLTEPFEQLSKTLETMQSTLKAATLLEIAGAVLLLAIAFAELAGINQGSLIQSSIAIGVMFAQLIGAMTLFQKFVGTKGFLKLPFMMASMVLLAGAIDILASAVQKLAALDWNGLAKGLVGLGVILTMISLEVKNMGNPTGLILAGLGLGAISGAIGVLVAAVESLSKLSWADLSKGLVGVATIMSSLTLYTKFAALENAGFETGAGIAEIAGAIQLLANVTEQLSNLSWEQIAQGLAGVWAILGGLALYTRFSDVDKAGITQGAGIILLAGAIWLLTKSVAEFDNISWEQIGKGLTGVSSLLISLALFTKFADADKGGVNQGAGILLLAGGIFILSEAMKTFAGFSWEQIGKGLTVTAGGLLIIGAALNKIPAKSVLSAAAVFIVASSLWMIADAVQKMGGLSWNTIAKGVLALASALGAIAFALALLPPSSLLSAAAIFIVASSLGMMAKALAEMGTMSWDAIAKSLVELAGALAIIAAAMLLMPEALPGAAALLVISAALAVLAPVLEVFGSMSWEEIGKSLVALVGVFLALGLSAVILAPIVPVISALGLAILLVGAGVFAAGLGLALFATALHDLGLYAGQFSGDISKAGPAITDALISLINDLIKVVNTEGPKINAEFIKVLLMLIADAVLLIPKMEVAGLNLLVGLLNGIANNIGKVVSAATNVITKFVSAIGSNALKVTQAAFNTVITFVNGLAQQCKTDEPQLIQAGWNLAESIVEGMVKGLGDGIKDVGSAAKSLAGSALSSIGSFLGINSPSRETRKQGNSMGEGMSLGMDDMHDDVASHAQDMSKVAITSMAKTLTGMGAMITGEVDVSPTITPVLDLSSVKSSASQIGGMLTTKPLTVDASVATAKIASAGYTANQEALAELTAASSTTNNNVTFNQTNTSPKALSTADIYRQTNNQISKVRGALVYQTGGNDYSG